jgi:hypothetical protein
MSSPLKKNLADEGGGQRTLGNAVNMGTVDGGRA